MGGVHSERKYYRYKSRHRTPAIRSRWAMQGACGDKDFTTLLLPEQCSPRHAYSLWSAHSCFPLFSVRGLHSAFSVRKLTSFSLKLSPPFPLCSILFPYAMFSSVCLPFPHLTFRHKEFTQKSTPDPFGAHWFRSEHTVGVWGLCRVFVYVRVHKCMLVSQGVWFLMCETAPFERACIFHSCARGLSWGPKGPHVNTWSLYLRLSPSPILFDPFLLVSNLITSPDPALCPSPKPPPALW